MEKEALLQRIRLWSTIIVVAFAVLVVTLVIQFGLIAHNNHELNRLRTDNTAKQEQIAELKNLKEYYESPEYKEQLLIENGKSPNENAD